jgi:D-alanyl-D-alanine carboxypeptidase (penicillin-binding protein 5/6)
MLCGIKMLQYVNLKRYNWIKKLVIITVGLSLLSQNMNVYGSTLQKTTTLEVAKNTAYGTNTTDAINTAYETNTVDTINTENATNESSLSLYAQNAVVMDGEFGDVLYEKEGDVLKANASTTKIMTCILALECAELSDVATVSSYATKMPQVKMGVAEGERYTIENLLLGLMLESYNDAAVVIAEHVAGSVEAFADMMNRKALEIGCRNTHFITPNGLDDENEMGIHGTSARDLALIMRYCINVSPERENFRRITAVRNCTFSNQDGTRSFSCTNHNSLFDMIDGTISGKTGFTCDAGYCYVGAVESQNRIYIVALLGCGWPNNKNYKWTDCRTLIDYAIEKTEYVESVEISLKEVEVTFSSKSAASVYVGTEIDSSVCENLNSGNIVPKKTIAEENTTDVQTYAIYVAAANPNITVEYLVPDSLSAPVTKGAVIGTAKIYNNNLLVDLVPIVVSEGVEDVTYKDELMKMLINK